MRKFTGMYGFVMKDKVGEMYPRTLAPTRKGAWERAKDHAAEDLLKTWMRAWTIGEAKFYLMRKGYRVVRVTLIPS